jgi:signal peptidase I
MFHAPICIDLAAKRRLTTLAMSGSLLCGAAAWSPVRLGVAVGVSMAPTLKPGHPFLYRPVSAEAEVQPGEVVVLRLGGETCVKRVLATGGQEFWAIGPKASKVTDLWTCFLIQGGERAKWARRFPTFKISPVRIPNDQIFVIGDGLCSYDSRQTGPIPRSQVLGRVMLPAEAPGRPRARWAQLPPVPVGRHGNG